MDRAGVEVPRADSGVAAIWSVIQPVGAVPSPALDLPVLTDRAGVREAGTDGAEAAVRSVGLSELVRSPALNRACVAQAAGMEAASADGGEAAIWGISLPDVVPSPALDLPAAADRTGVVVPRGDGDIAGRGVFGRGERDLGAAQPAACAGVGWEVACWGFDALAVGGRECELDPAIA